MNTRYSHLSGRRFCCLLAIREANCGLQVRKVEAGKRRSHVSEPFTARPVLAPGQG